MTFVPCRRCEGQMRLVRIADFFTAFDAFKCIQCGEIIDKIIIENRMLMKAGEIAEGGERRGRKGYTT